MKDLSFWRRSRSQWKGRTLTLLAKTSVMLSAELIFNAFMWIVAVIVFTRQATNQHKVLPLALVAWTTGLRHGLDADHISAIDNATRRIVSVPLVDDRGVAFKVRRPVTVGFFFSLGHSTIVIVTIIVVAISAQVASNLDSFGNVGSVVGPAVSGSFLILVGCINSYILHKTWSRIQSASRKEVMSIPSSEQSQSTSIHRFNGIMTRLAMPILKTVDRPWKLYPVGLLFGLGFDTASSIALLSIAVISQQDSEKDETSGKASVVLLAFLFTAGMTLVDSIDSCLMIWAYAPDLTSNGKIVKKMWEKNDSIHDDHDADEVLEVNKTAQIDEIAFQATCDNEIVGEGDVEITKQACCTSIEPCCKEKRRESNSDSKIQLNKEEAIPSDKLLQTLNKSASHMSLVLTLLSVIIAFAVGIIELLGLIGQECSRCSRAADQQETMGNGGLEGRWWLTWRRANDNFGYIGAAIIGLFTISVACYFTIRWVLKRKTTNMTNI